MDLKKPTIYYLVFYLTMEINRKEKSVDLDGGADLEWDLEGAEGLGWSSQSSWGCPWIPGSA